MKEICPSAMPREFKFASASLNRRDDLIGDGLMNIETSSVHFDLSLFEAAELRPHGKDQTGLNRRRDQTSGLACRIAGRSCTKRREAKEASRVDLDARSVIEPV